MDMKTNKTYRFFLIAAISCIMVCNHAQADNNRPVTLKQMPTAAQQFILKNFANTTYITANIMRGSSTDQMTPKKDP